jgi:hypothetical protein
MCQLEGTYIHFFFNFNWFILQRCYFLFIFIHDRNFDQPSVSKVSSLILWVFILKTPVILCTKKTTRKTESLEREMKLPKKKIENFDKQSNSRNKQRQKQQVHCLNCIHTIRRTNRWRFEFWRILRTDVELIKNIIQSTC